MFWTENDSKVQTYAVRLQRKKTGFYDKGEHANFVIEYHFFLLVTAELFCEASTAASFKEEPETGKSDWESTASPISHSWLLLSVDELLPRYGKSAGFDILDMCQCFTPVIAWMTFTWFLTNVGRGRALCYP